MSDVTARAERGIAAPLDRVYQCIADYRRHHGRWLPPSFSDYQVEMGGYGAGTVFRYHLKVGARERDYRMRVTEDDSASALTEEDSSSSLVTTWTATSENSGSRVRIETRWRGAGGVGGFFERIFAPRALTRLYTDMLDRLDRYAREAEI